MNPPFRMRIRNIATNVTVAEKYDDKPEVVVKQIAAIWTLRGYRRGTSPVAIEVYGVRCHGWRPLTHEERQMVQIVVDRMTVDA